MAAEAPDDDAPEEEALADETPEEEALDEEAPEEEALEQDAAADARPTFLEWSGRSPPVPPEDRMAMIERIALLTRMANDERIVEEAAAIRSEIADVMHRLAYVGRTEEASADSSGRDELATRLGVRMRGSVAQEPASSSTEPPETTTTLARYQPDLNDPVVAAHAADAAEQAAELQRARAAMQDIRELTRGVIRERRQAEGRPQQRVVTDQPGDDSSNDEEEIALLFHTLEHTTAEWRQQELSRRREAVAKQQARREAGAKAAIQIPPRPGRRLGEAITPAQEKAAALQRMVASGQEAALSPLEYSERRLGIKRASDAYDAQAVAGFLRTSPDAPREVRERSTTSLASTVRRHYLSHSLPAVSKHGSPAASSGAAASAAGRSRSRSPAAERRPSAERDDRDAPSGGGEAEGCLLYTSPSPRDRG